MLRYSFRSKKGNSFYFNSYFSWRVLDCPDYDCVREVRLLRVYIYPFHSPCYFLKVKTAYYKYGVKVNRTETKWFPCKVSNLHATYDSMSLISDVCGIRIYKGAWV